MRKTIGLLFVLIPFLTFNLGAGDKKAKKLEEAPVVAYDLKKLDLIDPYLTIARRATLPTISVLMPKDLAGFRDSFSYSVWGTAEFNRIFNFPSGFGLDTSFIGSALAGRYGQGGVGRGSGDELARVMAPVYAERGARQMGEYGLEYGYGLGSPLQSILQNELTMALTKSRKFNPLVPGTGPMSQDLRTIEMEKGIGTRRTERPLDKMPTADFFLGSSIGIKSIETSRSSFSGDNEITNFVESIFLSNTSFDKRQRISRTVDIFRSLFRYKDETLVNVVVNLYIADSRRIIVAGNGLGISKVDLSKGFVFAGIQREKIKTEDFLIEGVRKAVQDAFDNLSVLSAPPASQLPSQPVPQAVTQPTVPEPQSPQALPEQLGEAEKQALIASRHRACNKSGFTADLFDGDHRVGRLNPNQTIRVLEPKLGFWAVIYVSVNSEPTKEIKVKVEQYIPDNTPTLTYWIIKGALPK